MDIEEVIASFVGVIEEPYSWYVPPAAKEAAKAIASGMMAKVEFFIFFGFYKK